MNIYEFTIMATCPIDPLSVDQYEATLRTDTMVEVESLLAFVERYCNVACFQEVLTRQLRDQIGHGELTTVGTHSGVKVTCTAGGY